MKISIDKLKVVVIGLGYVGLPLAIEFAKKRNVIGFDIQLKRINELKKYNDTTGEITKKELKAPKKIIFTNKKKDLKKANCYIVAVPTPVNKNKKPDLRYLLSASKIVSDVLSKGDVVIYESTVYPGCTEEKCVPVLEKNSNLKFNVDFFCGYSPERINPGDKTHKISQIKKIVSGSTKKTSSLINKLYKEIITAGTHVAPSIKVAEAAKVIENTQRDLNIALINEYSIIFNKLHLDTESILKAAETKWNFLPFRPGLVGGHCIGVDPYYLTYKAESIGYKPKIILAGRKLNNEMGAHVVKQLILSFKKKSIDIKNSKILIMGLSFKENCTDLRNSGISNVIKELKNKKCALDLYDPLVDREKVKKIYSIYPIKKLTPKKYDGIIIAVAHDEFKKMKISDITNLGKSKHILYDLKYIFPLNKTDLRL